MKFSILCVMGLVAAASCGVSYPGNPVIDLDVIARMTAQELDQLAGGLAAEELIRTKRSGSGDILGHVSRTISSGLSSKLSLIGSASAGASSLFSGGSSKSHSYDHESYGPPEMVHTKGFDFWTLKSSILNTLFQAVKAITGGVTILKGQLLKGGGALVSGVGRIVSSKGDSVTNLGRHIVNSASLIPKKSSHSSASIHVTAPAVIHHHSPAPVVHHHTSPSGPSGSGSASYGPPTGPSSSHSYSSSPAIHYDGPSAPAPTYQYGPPSHNAIYSAPTKYASPFEDNYSNVVHWQK